VIVGGRASCCRTDGRKFAGCGRKTRGAARTGGRPDYWRRRAPGSAWAWPSPDRAPRSNATTAITTPAAPISHDLQRPFPDRPVASGCAVVTGGTAAAFRRRCADMEMNLDPSRAGCRHVGGRWL